MGRDLKSRAGFTLVELLVVIAILAMLVAMVTPTLGRTRDLAQRARCLSHLYALSGAHATYAADNQMYLPGFMGIVDMSLPDEPWGRLATHPTLTGLLEKGGYVDRPEIWLCPSVKLRCPGTFYEKNGYPGWYIGRHWTPQEIAKYPFTYHFTLNARTCFSRACDSWQRGEPLPRGVEPGTFWATDAAGKITYQRRSDSFSNPARVILLAEENTGMVPWDGQPSGVGSEVVNDPKFINPDVTEPRHLGESMGGYLDGHAGRLPAMINLERNSGYWP